MEDDFNDLSGMLSEENILRPLTDEQIKYMVSRFLGWRLPKNWNPDNGISYQRPNYAHAPADHDWPTGTNLLDADQAYWMVRHMAAGMPSQSLGEEVSAGRIRELWKECGGCVDKKKGRFWIEPEHCAELIRKIIGEITKVAYKSPTFTG